MTEGRSLVSVGIVIEAVARVFDVAPRAIRSHRKPASLMPARHAFYLLVTELCDLTYPEIGRILCRNHATIIIGANVAKELTAKDGDYAALVETSRCLALALAKSDTSRIAADPKATECAERIANAVDPIGAALRISPIEIVSVAARLCELEDTAALSYQLLKAIEDYGELPTPHTFDDAVGCQRAGGRIRHFAHVLSDALQALGYVNEESAHEKPAEVQAAAE